jgi:hypothetical protein
MLNRVCCLVSSRILLCELDSILWWRVPRDFDPRYGLAQPSPARPSSARAPLVPPAPHARAPSPGLFLSFDFSRASTSLSPTSLSLPVVVPLVLETVIAGFGPRGELPSPLPLSLPLPLPFLLHCTPPSSSSPPRRLGLLRAGGSAPTPCPPAPLRPAAAASPAARPRAPSPPCARRRRPRLRPRARGPHARRRRLGPAPVAPARPHPRASCPAARPRARRAPAALCARAPLHLASQQPCALSVLSRAPACAQHVRARATVVARRSTLSFISFLILV